MILFKITACPSKNQIGIYQHEALEMTIGSGSADMVIDDPEISAPQIKISHVRGQFFIANLDTHNDVRLNGEVLAGKAHTLKSNDSLTMASTSIFFTKVDDKPLTPPEKYVNESAQARLAKSDSTEAIILQSLDYMATHAGAPNPVVGTPPPAPTRGPGAAPPPIPKKR